MIADGRVLKLEGGLMTTRAVRTQEEVIESRFGALARSQGHGVSEQSRATAHDEVAERIGGRLSGEQAHALAIITGPEKGAVLIGPAGTGKGVVIDAAARAEQLSGRETLGIAVSGSTAQRLGRDSPALLDNTLTLDALVARVEAGRLDCGRAPRQIYFDEAGMGGYLALWRASRRLLEEHGREADGDRRWRAAAVDRRGWHVRAPRGCRAVG